MTNSNKHTITHHTDCKQNNSQGCGTGNALQRPKYKAMHHKRSTMDCVIKQPSAAHTQATDAKAPAADAYKQAQPACLLHSEAVMHCLLKHQTQQEAAHRRLWCGHHTAVKAHKQCKMQLQRCTMVWYKQSKPDSLTQCTHTICAPNTPKLARLRKGANALVSASKQASKQATNLAMHSNNMRIYTQPEPQKGRYGDTLRGRASINHKQHTHNNTPTA
ncbi:hypothetical protein COO60DRAFT_460657 [Scenedesmus sp. NREL 46B-D3]|nr:hypothetical protein COO60DRAFT_460657 [Scenedesmus sp. NREL 46B-D3]